MDRKTDSFNLVSKNCKQDGRLAPADFSTNYKYFDQLLQTVKNKTTVLILVLKECSQTSISPLISVLYAKGYHDFPLKKFLSKNFCLTVPKNFVGQPFRASLISFIEKYYASEGYDTIFRRKFFISVPKSFVEEPFCAVFQKTSGS